MHLNIELDSLPYTIHRFNPSTIPSTYLRLVEGQSWFSITKTTQELSIVISHDYSDESSMLLADDHRINGGWRCFKVVGPLDFSLVGILANLADALAVQSISVFVVSTFDTDYILVKKDKVLKAKKAFEDIGHSVKEVESFAE
ncbi:hypothetical protein HA402_011849 [Bradysia odoriphaga]|nr:hypothetical protein HA402_011849 [Bradysia odoriphaga]